MSRFRFCVGFVLCLSASAFASPPLKVGVVLPLSGPMAASGQSAKNSILLAQENFARAGEVRFLFEDDQFQSKNTVSATRKLIDQDRVQALIVWGTPTALAVNDIAERAKLPMIALSLLERVVHGKRFVMKHWLPSATIHEQILREVRDRQYRRVAVVALSNEAMIDLSERFQQSGVTEVVTALELPGSVMDFRMEVVRLQQYQPDAIYLLLWTPQLSTFARQLRGNKYRGAIFGVQNMEDEAEISASKGALEGAWFVGLDDREAKEFYRQYQQHFSMTPVAGAPNAYDVASILIHCQAAPVLNDCLHALKDFQGVLGTYGATSQNDFQLRSRLKCIRNGVVTDSQCHEATAKELVAK